jgi:hypothetical protein
VNVLQPGFAYGGLECLLAFLIIRMRGFGLTMLYSLLAMVLFLALLPSNHHLYHGTLKTYEETYRYSCEDFISY